MDICHSRLEDTDIAHKLTTDEYGNSNEMGLDNALSQAQRQGNEKARYPIQSKSWKHSNWKPYLDKKT